MEAGILIAGRMGSMSGFFFSSRQLLPYRWQSVRRLYVSGLLFALVVGCGNVLAGGSAGTPLLLPNQLDGYVEFAVTNLPAHFETEIARDNTPADNPLTDAGATLGRVLFYDKRVSHNNSMACSSCHFQENGFSDPRPQSVNSDGTLSDRHSLALANGAFYSNGRFLSDESAETLEEQVLRPIQTNELGSDLATLNVKLAATDFYGDLFTNAFGDSEITTDRISKALSQFVRSMVSYESKFDSIFDETGRADPSLLTAQEQHGLAIFNGAGRCATCHESSAQISDEPRNNGLTAFTEDEGAGDGAFKAVSLRNSEVRGAFFHDGGFSSLEEVVAFYSEEIQDHPDLDFRLRENFDPNGAAVQLNFSDEESAALVAFLRTLTDQNFLTDPKFSNPFVLTCDFDDDDLCGVSDLDLLLAEGPLGDGIAVDAANAIFDMNGDGVLNSEDAEVWLAVSAEANGFSAAYFAGDANLDGVVDVSDFNAWNSNRFTNSTGWSAGDFNFDGVVDGSDFNIWNENNFSSLSGFEPPTVPEPEGLTLIGAGLLLLAWRSRTRKVS